MIKRETFLQLPLWIRTIYMGVWGWLGNHGHLVPPFTNCHPQNWNYVLGEVIHPE